MPRPILRRLLLSALACVPLAGCDSDSVGVHNVPAPQPLRIIVDSSRIVAQSDFSSAASASQTVLTSDSAYTAWWASLGAGVPIPTGVSFVDSVLIGVTQGPRSTSGYGVWVDSLTGSSAHPVVHIRERTSVGCPVLAVETSPFQVVQLPALGDSVTFAITTYVRTCP